MAERHGAPSVEAVEAPPDLLSHVPSLRLDPHAARQTLAFAFSGGSHGGAFERLFDSAALPASAWDPAHFAADLFLGDFVATCAEASLGARRFPLNRAYLTRVLSRPPAADETVALRRGLLAELRDAPAKRAELERLYVSLTELRQQFEAQPLTRRLGARRRRIDILASVKAAIDLAASSFEGAGPALASVRSFARGVREGEAYARLADLLEYDERVATLDLRVRVGVDGRVRGSELLATRENRGNRFYASPFGRWWSKALLLLRGYRVRDEELLARVIEGVFDGVERAVMWLVQLSGDVEFYLAALAFADRAEARGLRVCLPSPPVEGATRVFEGLFNPLLLTQATAVVPCDLRPDGAHVVIVTGPNSGGKTRLLQSIGLAQTLGQGGFFVPAARAVFVPTRGLFMSLTEHAKADQTEGRFGTELLRIRSLFEKLRVGGMVLLDELCSGTDPSEGEEMFELVVTLLAELRPQAFVTTHFLRLASRLAAAPPTAGLGFWQVELGEHERPTYRFIDGVAETSLAHQTAARLGVTRAELASLVRASVREYEAGRPATTPPGS